MSHIVKIEVEINDLASLKKACSRLGLEFRETQKSFKWYGQDVAECDHAIAIPNNTSAYEIGVMKAGKGYELKCDFWNRQLKEKIGEGGGLLKQAYAIEKARAEALRKGFSVRERNIDGRIELRIQVR